MDPLRRFQLTNLALFVVAGGHALATWPFDRALILFCGGAAVAFVAEAVVIRVGLLEHRMRPQLLGVPLSVLVAWPAVVYLTYRAAVLVVPAGVPAAALAAVLATALDVLTDPQGVAADVWRYPAPDDRRLEQLSALRYRGVPWWNFAGWLALVFVISLLPTLVVPAG